MSAIIIPALILCIFVYGFLKGVNTYKSFTKGASDAIRLCLDILPFICAILIAIQLISMSGVLDILVRFIGPVFELMGIPRDLTAFIILKPFSGSGSIALFEEIVVTHGADSQITRIASVIAGSSETVFYISAVYFSKTNIKKLGMAIPVALFCTILAAVLAAFVVRIM
ncbi:MAG: spore maturation protein [Firmicutes bacterium]|nr:spore maturation protein [Bacillota bacterium]